MTAEQPPIRASDADREQAADGLRHHAAEGRISTEELEERLGAVYAAKTDFELREISADLPSQRSGSGVVQMSTRERSVRRLAQDGGRGGIVVLVCVAIWLADGADGQFWPVWVMLAVFVRLAQDGWRLHGPGAGLRVERSPDEQRLLERRALERSGRRTRRRR